MWTESIAVGSGAFVRHTEKQTTNRMELEVVPTDTGAWTIREPLPLTADFRPRKSPLSPLPQPGEAAQSCGIKALPWFDPDYTMLKRSLIARQTLTA